LGRHLDNLYIDKWTLYEIGRHCDEPVKSGLFHANGEPIYEPRFTFHGVFDKGNEAHDVMHLNAPTLRGMAYWASGAITASQDSARDPDLIVGPSNVIGGEFNRTSSALNARHTVVEVKWTDPSQKGASTIEVVRDFQGIKRYGERVKKIEAF